MNLKTKLSDTLKEISEAINQAILNREYELIAVGPHTIAIEALGFIAEIWNSNNPEHTKLYRLMSMGDVGFEGDLGFLDVAKFEKPARCRMILRGMTDGDISDHIADLEYKIKKLEQEVDEL